jgi:hypothetical protein
VISVSRKGAGEGGLGFRVDLHADGRVAEVWLPQLGGRAVRL